MTGPLETRLALAEVAARYAQAVDRRRRADLVALFTTDAVLVQPPALVRRGKNAELAGNETIATGLLAAVGHLHATHHVVGQQVVETCERDSAIAETYCMAHHLYTHGDGLRDNSLAIRYRDEFRLEAGQWRIARRELVVDFAEDRAVTQPG